MKKIIFILCTGLFAFACNNNNNQTSEAPQNTDRIIHNVKGKVQHVVETPYKVDSAGKIGEIDSCCIAITEFDETGYNKKYFTKNSKGVIQEDFQFSRYDNGLLKEQVDIPAGKKKVSYSFQLTEEGAYSGVQRYDSTGKMDAYYTDLKNNEYGQFTEFKEYKPDSPLQLKWTGVYDKNIWMSTTTTDSTGKVNGTYKAKVDDKGNVIELTSSEVKKDSTINKVITYKYEYDNQGNWTQRTEYDEKGRPVKIARRAITYFKVD